MEYKSCRFRSNFGSFTTTVKVKITEKFISLTLMKNFNLLLWICTIWMITFEEYVFDLSFYFLSLWQLKASWWLELVMFLFTSILVFGIPIPDPSKFLNFFLLYRICLQYFQLTNVMMVFFELTLDFPMWWHSSI